LCIIFGSSVAQAAPKLKVDQLLELIQSEQTPTGVKRFHKTKKGLDSCRWRSIVFNEGGVRYEIKARCDGVVVETFSQKGSRTEIEDLDADGRVDEGDSSDSGGANEQFFRSAEGKYGSLVVIEGIEYQAYFQRLFDRAIEAGLKRFHK
ncbi:MAG: hypothetical protein Q7R83_02090, partial [bacterium]|nr:hypothetical protein [bacterium]